MNETHRVVKFIEAKCGRVAVKGSGEGGTTSECFYRSSIAVGEDEKSNDGWWQ